MTAGDGDHREPISGATALLHNMSGPPTTPITWQLRALGKVIVGFDGQTLRSTRASATRLDAAWSAYGLRGAVNLFPFEGVDFEGFSRHGYGEILVCTDQALVLNVLGRVRSNLLLARSPLALEPGFLRRSLASDDPRLVALVRGTSHVSRSPRDANQDGSSNLLTTGCRKVGQQ